MLLTNVQVTKFKSIDDSNNVSIDPSVTVFVRQNKSGKTAFLNALHKAKPADKGISYNVVEDYPRKWLNDYYPEKHSEEVKTVIRLTYSLDTKDVKK